MKKEHARPAEAEFDRALDALRKFHLKVTQPRQAILKALIQEHGPFTMEELHRRMGALPHGRKTP